MPEKGRSAETEEGLKRWLEGIGLGHHSDLFLRHRIDFDVMSDLTETDLSELGLPLGDRKRLQRAMASLVSAPSIEIAAGTGARPLKAAVGAERRQLTVMFCDMVGSTSLSEQFDPEDVRDMIAGFRETCVRLVKNYDGFAARYVGDGCSISATRMRMKTMPNAPFAPGSRSCRRCQRKPSNRATSCPLPPQFASGSRRDLSSLET